MKISVKSVLALLAIVLVAVGTSWVVRRYHQPGQLDVISAQAMDMSGMRPPTGAAPVALTTVRQGSLAETVTYTGSVQPLNEQDIAPRITGTLLSVPVYPGDTVHRGQQIAQLDTAEVGAKADQAIQEARVAAIAAQVAHLTHHLHHRAALDQASTQVSAAQQSVADAQATAQASQDGVTEAQSELESAQSNADYWKAEIVREKGLADAGAASQQEYQNEQAQAKAAIAAAAASRAKVAQAKATVRSTQAKVMGAQRQVQTAQAGVRMAQADLAVAGGQAEQAGASASAARSAARQAAVVLGYSRITAPTDGVVSERPVAPGTLVQPGTVILKISEIDRVRVQANVAASDLAGIHTGTPVQIRLDTNAAPINARVTSLFPTANSETRTAVVEAIVPNPGHRLQPGAYVTMQFSRHQDTEKLQVPAGSIVSQGGQAYVWATRGGQSAGQVYECVICHIHYTAAQAAKHHYRDPMEGGKLVPLKKGKAPASTSGLTAHQIAVTVGASNGHWTEVTSPDLAPGDRVIFQGQAGLSEGARVTPTVWGTNGPQSLPTAASASAGMTLYRCEKCGMTYSEADAKKNHFIDPMDGGQLIAIRNKS